MLCFTAGLCSDCPVESRHQSCVCNFIKVNSKSVFSMGYFSSWDVGIVAVEPGTRHAQCCVVIASPWSWEVLCFGGIDGNGPTPEEGGFGLFFCSLLVGLGERKQLLLAAVKLDIWQITPIYTVKNPKGQGQSSLQTGGRETGAANAEHCVFLPGHLLVQRSGKAVCLRAVFCFDGFWHPFQHLEEGCCDVSAGRASSVLTSPSWPGLIRMLIKPAFSNS